MTIATRSFEALVATAQNVVFARSLHFGNSGLVTTGECLCTPEQGPVAVLSEGLGGRWPPSFVLNFTFKFV